MPIPHSAFVRRFVEMRGHVPAALYRTIAREAVERARPVAFRAAPLDFSDLVERLEAAAMPKGVRI